MIVYLKTASLSFVGEEITKSYPSLAEARAAAERIVGNRAYTKPFRNEQTYMYGPGNGDTTIIVTQDIDEAAFMEGLR